MYRVDEVEKITDGDTLWLRLDVGFRQHQLTHLRLLDCDAPELNRGSTFEKQQAALAVDLLYRFFEAASQTYWCETRKDPDNFGRWLAAIWREPVDGGGPREYLHELLIAKDLAVRWPTRWREVYDRGGAT